MSQRLMHIVLQSQASSARHKKSERSRTKVCVCQGLMETQLGRQFVWLLLRAASLQRSSLRVWSARGDQAAQNWPSPKPGNDCHGVWCCMADQQACCSSAGNALRCGCSLFILQARKSHKTSLMLGPKLHAFRKARSACCGHKLHCSHAAWL